MDALRARSPGPAGASQSCRTSWRRFSPAKLRHLSRSQLHPKNARGADATSRTCKVAWAKLRPTAYDTRPGIPEVLYPKTGPGRYGSTLPGHLVFRGSGQVYLTRKRVQYSCTYLTALVGYGRTRVGRIFFFTANLSMYVYEMIMGPKYLRDLWFAAFVARVPEFQELLRSHQILWTRECRRL